MLKSLTTRLLFGSTSAVAAILLLAGWSLYALVERNLVGEVDRALLDKARLLASTVEQEGRSLHIEFADPETAAFVAGEPGEHLQLSVASGEVVYRSPSLGEHTFELGTLSDTPIAAWDELPDAVRCRRITLPFEPVLADDADPAVVPAKLALVLARDARDVVRSLSMLRGLLVIVGFATLATAAAVLVAVVRYSVRPLVVTAERIATISEDDLSVRLDVSRVPSELASVVQRVNALLARLEAAFARERAFSDDVAHELRTPLAALRAALEVSGTRPRSEQEYAQTIGESELLVADLQAMVERLLQLARLDAGRLATESRSYELGELVTEAWEPYAARALARGLRVDLDLQHGLEVSLDRELVGLILRNLHDNAVAYADSSGRLRIQIRALGNGAIRIRVSNTGSRLDQEQAASATRRFWRGDAARSAAGRHCGLGLALVEKATLALGGSLRLSSDIGGEFVAEVTLQDRASARTTVAI